MMRCGTIDANDAGAGGALNRISCETSSVTDVVDVHLLVRPDIRGFQEGTINRDGTFIIKIRFRHRGAVQLGFKHRALHSYLLSDKTLARLNAPFRLCERLGVYAAIC